MSGPARKLCCLQPFRWLGLAVVGWAALEASADPFISEVLFNPPGTDTPNQYIELRGTPNYVFPPGSYFLSVAGGTNNPGVIQDLFDLSGRAIGGNGFLVLLQKANTYVVNSNATVLINSGSGSGWGSGSSSSIGHRGQSGHTDLDHGSQTFLLIQTTNAPTIGADIDSDDNGVPDGAVFASWRILDAVGVLDRNGGIAYGLINFRRNPAGIASGTIVSVSFDPGYVGRSGNTTDSAPAEWVASDNLGVAGAVPNWVLGSTANTVPTSFATLALNHLGGPNFDAPEIPGIVAQESGGSTDVLEGDGTDAYALLLNTPPSGNVAIQISTSGQTQISTDGGQTFGSSSTLTFSSTLPQTVIVRALDDHVVDTSPHWGRITHEIISTQDPAHYPVSTSMPTVNVNITEVDWVLLSELKVNPPGTNDTPYEYLELRGPPNTRLQNVYVLVIEGDANHNPGITEMVVNLNNTVLGSSGLLVIAAPGNPYAFPSGTTVLLAPELATLGGALDNGALSILLVSSPTGIPEGVDLDAGNNGVLKGLPAGTTILDAIGWSTSDTNDIVYGGVTLTQPSGTPDAATRFSNDNTPRSTAAWFNGDLAGTSGEALIYDSSNVSSNFPYGAILTPGYLLNSPPGIGPLVPFSSVIGDPTSPDVPFRVTDAHIDPSQLVVTARSSNPLVVPEANVTVIAGQSGQRFLHLEPMGVGYATLTLTVSNGEEIGQTTLEYAASVMGRPGGQWHTGTSDASTAIGIDEHLMFVGDNENQVLRLYDRTRSGGPVAAFNMDPFLGLTDFHPDGSPREVNIEASTRVDNRFFWCGCHCLDALAEPAPNRMRLFATDTSGTGTNAVLTYVGRYDYLVTDLVNWDMNNGHGKGANYYGLAASTAPGMNPKASDGFNIEGLAMGPGGSTTGYIGFRAPIVPATNRLFALIVPVLNFAALAISGGTAGSAVFGPPIELDLGGRGIRTIEGNAHGYLICAGPASDSPKIPPANFVLYTWSGNAADPAQLRAADLTGITGEGVVDLPTQPWEPDTQFQLVSDDGRKIFYNDGIQAKYLPEPNFKKFRSDWVTLGAVVIPPPTIQSIVTVAGELVVTWRALAGHTYCVEFTTDLNQSNWNDASTEVTATYPIVSQTMSARPEHQSFYRIRLVR